MEQPTKKQKKQRPTHIVDDESGDEADSTYNKFKTQNEIAIGEAYKTGP
jgi:hypothetical protein